MCKKYWVLMYIQEYFTSPNIRKKGISMIKTVIFDLDGTLLNTLDDLADSMNYALSECGYPKREKEEIRRFIGGGATVLVRSSLPEGVSEEEYEKCLRIFLPYYKENSDKKTGLYPGIKKLVDRLYKENYSMAVVSTKGDAAVKKLISKFLGERISIALGEEKGIRRKPAPDSVLKAMELLGAQKETTVYVGDSEVDVETAKNAGIPCISVTWGFRDKEEIARYNAGAMADTVEELYLQIKNRK